MRFAICALALGMIPLGGAADWPQFRGPNGSGVADDQKPPVKFGPEENLAWKVAVPPGASSPIVVGDRIILTAFEDDKLATICYSSKDGKELWRKPAPATKIEAFHPSEGSPAASTPASDGSKVVVYFGSCGLLCYDLDGQLLWKFELPVADTNFGFGTGTSPIISGGLVYLARDLRKDSAVYAIDLATGSQKWKTDRPKSFTNYCTPLVWDADVKRTLVVPGTTTLTGYDAATGAELWQIGKLAAVNCTSPVLAGDQVILTSWAPGGADMKMPSFDEVLKQAGEEKLGYLTKAGSEKTMLKGFFDNNDLDKDGKLTREEWNTNVNFLKSGENRAVAVKPGTKGETSWSYTKFLPYIPSPLVYRGRVYWLKDGPQMTCLDVKTGKPIFEGERLKAGARYYASPVAANGHIYLASLEGIVAVVAAGEETPDLVYSVKLAEGVRATPAIAHDTLYVRSDKFLYAFKNAK